MKVENVAEQALSKLSEKDQAAIIAYRASISASEQSGLTQASAMEQALNIIPDLKGAIKRYNKKIRKLENNGIVI